MGSAAMLCWNSTTIREVNLSHFGDHVTFQNLVCSSEFDGNAL